MVRCYVCGHRVVGFGHNLITALMTPTAIDTTSSTPQPMGRAMFGPEVTRFAALRKAMEDRWIPEMKRLLSIADHDLPLLWEDRKSTRLNSSHYCAPRMTSSA